MSASAEEIQLLKELISRYSPSEQERPAVEFLVAEMARRGFESFIDEAGNAVGVLGAGRKEVLLLGHIDTVTGWIDIREEGSLLYGRGAVDAKGPLSAFVAGATRAMRQLAPDELRLKVVGAVEEEAATSRGARHLLTQGQPDYVVIGEPSRWDRITLGYKGRLLVDYAFQQERRHTAGREASVCEEMVGFWLRVKQYADAYNSDKERLFDTLDPSLRHVASGSDGLLDEVNATVALRLPPGVQMQALQESLRRLAEPGTLRFYAEEVAFRADKNTPLTRAFVAAIRKSGGTPGFKVKTGTSDMNVVGPVWGCPIVAYGPGDSNLDHTPDEHIDLEEYGRAIAVLTDALVTLARQ